MNLKNKLTLLATSLIAPIGFVGCSGGGGSGGFTSPTASPTAVPGPNINALGLTTDNRLVSFNARTPGTSTTLAITGIPSGQTLTGIDFRFAPDAAGSTGLYGLVNISGASFQLYRINVGTTSATATAVGVPFSAVLNASSIGFDFNPQVASATDATVRVDRIRVVSGNRTNLRLVPNTGAVVDTDATTAGTQIDGPLTYDTTDTNTGRTPRVVAAAYTNNVATASPSGTINYGIDVSTGTLITQGRPDRDGAGSDVAVSPNTGRLFTVGSLGVTVGDRASFDIGPGSNNTALLVNNTQLSTVNLSSGRATVIGNVQVPSGTQLAGLAIVPSSQI
jgi:hypothetical protein